MKTAAETTDPVPVFCSGAGHLPDCRRMCILLAAAAVLLILVTIGAGTALGQERVHQVFFEGTDHELNVYHIYGKETGPTLLLIGGIQGDEPGGYLAVDHYVDISLARGNLIVVPRANFQSILLNRRLINQDMNRTFAEDRDPSYEAEVADILKTLIAESDCLLNNHDGSGFFSETWVDANRNPRRFGQSIIADAETFTVPDTGKVINLGALARAVCDEVNGHIKNPDHHFHFNNHRTDAASSLHKEQRKSATYYALQKCHIPAFGVESSKSLPLELKVRHHHLAINAFMDRLGIVTESPGMNLSPPQLRYLVVNVNNALPTVVQEGQALHVRSGDTVTVSHIEANFERGLSADILGVGTINDFRKPLVIRKSTRIAVRKDYRRCGSVHLVAGDRPDVSVSLSPAAVLPRGLLLFRVRINGEDRIYPEGEHVQMVLGDRFEIVDVITGLPDTAGLVVNLKGFVGDRQNNTGEDRGFVIHTDRDLWKRYSLKKKGLQYQVRVTYAQELVGKLLIDLKPPELKYVVLGIGDETGRCLASGQTWPVVPGRPVRLVDIATNVQGNLGVRAVVCGAGSARYPVGIQDNLAPLLTAGATRDDGCRIEILRQDLLLGFFYLTLASEGNP
ncbi:MAG: succinylglutamate desuccinylase/aspartoacylase family protein [Desulfobacterales bacterium]|nr:succinylglutamate desuccinylase/aspartoacylase family protein [Desulfobacterales bacterium]